VDRLKVREKKRCILMAADGCGAGLQQHTKLRCRPVELTRPRGNGQALLLLVLVRRGIMVN